MDVKVEVRGIRELNSAFRRLDAGVSQRLKANFLAIAEAVAVNARGRVPHRSGDAAASIKARASSRGASIAFGGTKAPYFPWLDFGGSTGRGHQKGVSGSGSIKREWRGRPVGEGRYIYPAIRAMRPQTERAVDRAIAAAADATDFETRGI